MELGNKCCETCKYRKDLVKFDYSCFGCVHTDYDGYACTAFATDGRVIHMVGVDPEIGFCEMYSKGKKQR